MKGEKNYKIWNVFRRGIGHAQCYSTGQIARSIHQSSSEYDIWDQLTFWWRGISPSKKRTLGGWMERVRASMRSQ